MSTIVLRSESVGPFTVELLNLEETTSELHVRDFHGNSIRGTPAQMGQLALEILATVHDEIEVR